jgi:hypothetical protein
MTSGSPASAPSAVVVLVGALEIATVILALLFGAPAWAAAAAGAAALAGALLRDRLVPQPKVWAVAVCGLTAVVAGFTAEGVRATFFEPDDTPHRYVVHIPETEGVRRRMSPDLKAEELWGGPLVVRDSVLVACLAKRQGYEWAQLEQDGSWVLARFLRLAPGGKSAPRCDDATLSEPSGG